MLNYLGKGQRTYGITHIPIHARKAWEFQALLSGRAAPLLRETPQPDFAASRLWVFPPTTAHGWTGDGERVCEVAVFHFSGVPEAIRSAAFARGFLSCALDRAASARIRSLIDMLSAEHERPTALGGLRETWALNELSVIALRDEPVRPANKGDDFARAKADAALTWYTEHLGQNPSLSDAARAVYVSISHLRRLFQRAHRQSPQSMFARLRFQRACELMRNSDQGLEAIAQSCGFQSASAFSRAFRAESGMSPRAWRQGTEQSRPL
jgi:AraC-like DNA-binding protein